MASSVSSERAFSQGGITITKRRNRLKSDLVEALQCVKCSIRHDLLFREPAPSSALETEIDGDEDQEDEMETWDDLLLDKDGDDDEIADDESD